MRSVILGTAGHVDHGKTALVQALTGVNTDRWQEERDRGITIDLGFAPFPTGSDDLEVAVVDVPGHEDFVKNMLAGASGIDLVLLVVAADEGPMPQTREHLWIARLLGVELGVVALTKTDLVDPEWLEMVAEATREEVDRVMGPVNWPVLRVSAVTEEGLVDLREQLLDAGRRLQARRDDDLFRLPIDRAFSVRGVGTVVTGSVWSGKLEPSAEVRILPGDQRARVRGLEVHGREVEVARAGQRAAVALSGVDRVAVRRGAVLTTDTVWRATRIVDVELSLVPDSPWRLKHWQRVRFHLGTCETMARVVLFGRDELKPGETAQAQVRLEEPVVARGGDRFVVRFYSPVTTVGGGRVLDPWAQRRSQKSVAGGAGAARGARDDLDARLEAAIRRLKGASEPELAILTGSRPDELHRALKSLEAAGAIRSLATRWFDADLFRTTRAAVLATLSRGHSEDAGARGVSLEALRGAAATPAELTNAVLADLERSGEIRVEGAVAALAGHIPRLRPEQREIATAAQQEIAGSHWSPPTVVELAAGLSVRAEELLPVLKFLVEEGELVAVTADLYYDSGAIREVTERVRAYLGDGRPAPPSQLREVLGVSRKYLIPLLEYLDRVGVTLRTEGGRVLRDESGHAD